MKHTLKQARQVAEKFGATIEVGDYNAYDQSTEISAIAPDGMMWSDTGSHFINVRKFRYAKGSAEEAYSELIKRMSYGTEPKNFE